MFSVPYPPLESMLDDNGEEDSATTYSVHAMLKLVSGLDTLSVAEQRTILFYVNKNNNDEMTMMED